MSDQAVIDRLKALVKETEGNDPILAAHIAMRIIEIKRGMIT